MDVLCACFPALGLPLLRPLEDEHPLRHRLCSRSRNRVPRLTGVVLGPSGVALCGVDVEHGQVELPLDPRLGRQRRRRRRGRWRRRARLYLLLGVLLGAAGAVDLEKKPNFRPRFSFIVLALNRNHNKDLSSSKLHMSAVCAFLVFC